MSEAELPPKPVTADWEPQIKIREMLAKYPTIIQQDDGFYELRCGIFDSNSHYKPHADSSWTGRKFFSEIKGIVHHLAGSRERGHYPGHTEWKGGMEMLSRKDCARKLSDDEVDDLIDGRAMVKMVKCGRGGKKPRKQCESIVRLKVRNERDDDDDAESIVVKAESLA